MQDLLCAQKKSEKKLDRGEIFWYADYTIMVLLTQRTAEVSKGSL
jgi:hypothetical protein